MAIRIVTDSTAALSREFADKHGIEIVPLTIRFSDWEYREGFSEEHGDFYQKLQSSAEFPKTSQPSPEDFAQVFKRLTAAGDEVVCVTLASSLSGTHASAQLAAQGMENISVVDTGTTCSCAQFVIEEILSGIAEGQSRAQVVARAEQAKQKQSLIFMPESLEYLKRGGRMSHLQVSIASVLRIKPVFLFRNGVLRVAKKAMGINMAINEIISLLPKNIKKIAALCIGSSVHLETLLQKLREKLGDITLSTVSISPVVGVHVGPGAIGLACMEE